LKISLNPYGHGEVKVKLDLQEVGWWRVKVSSGGVASEALIARLPQPYMASKAISRFGTENYFITDDEIALMSRMGIHWYRHFLSWEEVEPEEGKLLKLDSFLAQFQAIQKAGMGLIVVFISPPKWMMAKGRTGTFPLPENTAEFVARLEKAGIRPDYWEIWNEYQGHPAEAASYIAQVIAVKERLRGIGSQAKVLGAVTSVHGDAATWAWNESVIRAGLLKECDDLAFHGYMWPGAYMAVYPESSNPPFSERVERLRKLMDENNGSNMLLFDTETGILGRSAYSLHEDYVNRYEDGKTPFPSAREQARRYAQTLTIELSCGVNRIFQYMSGWGTIGIHREVQSSLFEPSMEPRPAALAIATCASELDAASPAGKWDPSPLIRGWLFERSGDTTCVFWGHDPNNTLLIKLQVPGIKRLVDMCGTEWPVSLLENGLKLDGDVWYLVISASVDEAKKKLFQAIFNSKTN